jgi:hypothetical protein
LLQIICGETAEIKACISLYNQTEMQIRQPNTLERETRSSLVDIFDTHHAGPLAIGDQQFDDLIQKFFLNKSKSEIFERIVKPMMKRNLYEAEGKSAGSAELFLKLCEMHFSHEGNAILTKIDWDKISHQITKMAKIRPTRSEIFRLIDKRSTKDTVEVLKEALSLSSRDDIIEVVRAYDVKTSITTELGCTFNDIKIEPLYYATKPWSKNQVNIILVDGVIEKSIHVEHILQKSNTDKEPYIIICREATEEVKNVCSTNFLRQTTDVVLCTVPYSEKTAHIFEDLKVVTACEVISPEMGDIITVNIYKKASKVRKVNISRGALLIENDRNERIKRHRESLIEKMNQINDDEVTDLIRKRHKSMSGRKILIKVGNDLILKQRNIIEQFDKILREIRDGVASGILMNTDAMTFLSKDDICRPIHSIKVAIDAYLSFITVLSNTGLILLDE